VPDERPPLELSAADIKALRYLGMTWGAIIMGAWLVLDERTALYTTVADVAILAATLLALYLLRRWKARR
jgi:hypothetical protein